MQTRAARTLWVLLPPSPEAPVNPHPTPRDPLTLNGRAVYVGGPADIDCFNFGTTTRNVQLKLKNFPTHLQPKIVNKKKIKKRRVNKKRGKEGRASPALISFSCQGNANCVHWLEASGIFPIRKSRSAAPPSSSSSAAPNPFYLVPLWPQEFHQICSQCRPIFRAGGCAVAVAAEAALEITSINFRLIFIFISYSAEEIFLWTRKFASFCQIFVRIYERAIIVSS